MDVKESKNENKKSDLPWIEKYRPRVLNEVAHQEEVITLITLITFFINIDILRRIFDLYCFAMVCIDCGGFVLLNERTLNPDDNHDNHDNPKVVSALRRTLSTGNLPHLLFYGPPGITLITLTTLITLISINPDNSIIPFLYHHIRPDDQYLSLSLPSTLLPSV